MKKISFLALAVFALSFYSCNVEPVDPAALANAANNPGGGGNGGGNNGGGGGSGSTGDYYPAALNNQWRYKTNGVLDTDPMKIVQVVNTGGVTVYKFNPQNPTTSLGNTSSTTLSLKKINGDYIYIVDGTTVGAGTPTGYTATGFEYTVLKDYLNVGQTWTGTYSQVIDYNDPNFPDITQVANYTGEILGKDLTITVNGQTYPNVIHMKLSQEYTILGMPIGATETEVWYAKNVGPVKSELLGLTSYTKELDSYILN